MLDITEVYETIDGRFGVLVNGYQWGDDESQFNYLLGCSSQTWATKEEAAAAYRNR